MEAVIPAKAGIQYSRGRAVRPKGRGGLDRSAKPGDDSCLPTSSRRKPEAMPRDIAQGHGGRDRVSSRPPVAMGPRLRGDDSGVSRTSEQSTAIITLPAGG